MSSPDPSREREGRFSAGAIGLYRAAALLLGWRPAEFWAATPQELADALAPTGEDERPDRAAIEAMMRRFPDQ